MFIEDEKILTPQDWVFPIPIAYGPGRIWEVGDYCTKYGISNPLIVLNHSLYTGAICFIAK